MNSGYENVTINDNNNELVDIYKAFKTKTSTEIYNYIYKTIVQAKFRTKEDFEKFKNKTAKSKGNLFDLFLFEKFGRYSALYLDKNGICNVLVMIAHLQIRKAYVVLFLKLQNFFEN